MAKYKVHIFKTSNNFTVNSLTGNVTADKMEYLVVAGGGGGGYNYGGGGGAGGVLSANSNIIATTYTVTVGAGGSGSLTDQFVQGFNGSNSSISGSGFTTVNSVGGGGGGSGQNKSGKPGGSGGGNSINGGTGGSGIPGQGNPGGTGDGEGGGGAGDAGIATRGGNGIYSTISGSNVAYGGGGGGWGRAPSPLGGTGLEPGGIGGGGAGATNLGNIPAVNGNVNTGGGGGGGLNGETPGPYAGADGGSGIVIIRYPLIPRPIASRISSVTNVSTDANTYYGDQTVTVQVTTANVVSTETLYYSVKNTSNSQVVGGNTGSFSVTSNNYVAVPVTLNISGTSNIAMQIRRNSGTGSILRESQNITIRERSIAGGTIVETANEVIHVFTTSGILTTATSLSSPVIANVMIIGGGGRGGPYGHTYAGGGGGAGGIRFANVELRAGNTFTITVGAGAVAAQHNPANQVFDGGFASLNYLAAAGAIIGNFSKFDAPLGYIKGLSDGRANVNYRAWGGGQGAGVRTPPSLGGGWFTSSRGGSGGGGGGNPSTPPSASIGAASTGNYAVVSGNPSTFVGRSDAEFYEDLGSSPTGNTAVNISWTYNSGYDGGASVPAPPSSGGGGGGGGGHGSQSDPTGLVGAAGGIGIGISGLPTSYGTPGPVPGLRYFAGGGGGGMSSQGTQPNPALRGGGIGGDGGGGRGGGGNNPVYTPSSDGSGFSGLQNTGGGGGGGGKPNQTVVNSTCIGGGGGSGIVIIRYPK